MTMGTLGPFRVNAGTRSTGRWSSDGSAQAGRSQSPTAAGASPRKPRRVSPADAGVASLLMSRRRADRSMPSWIELRPTVRVVDVRLERLHGRRVRVELHALGGLLDAPVDHVAQRAELADLLLELRELVRVRVRRVRVAHGARHAGPGELRVHLLLRGLVAVEQQVPEP